MSLKHLPLCFALTLLLISCHWVLVHTYATYCAPPGIQGLLLTWFTTGSPVCQFLNHLQVALGNNFVSAWDTATTTTILWFASLLTTYCQ